MQCNDFTYVVRFYGVKFNTKEVEMIIVIVIRLNNLYLKGRLFDLYGANGYIFRFIL
jgi:hypothetical protein